MWKRTDLSLLAVSNLKKKGVIWQEGTLGLMQYFGFPRIQYSEELDAAFFSWNGYSSRGLSYYGNIPEITLDNFLLQDEYSQYIFAFSF